MNGEEWNGATSSTFSLSLFTVSLCVFSCVNAPTAFLFSFSPQGQNKCGAAAADLRTEVSCRLSKPELIPNKNPEERSSNDHNDDKWRSEMLTGGFLKFV